MGARVIVGTAFALGSSAVVAFGACRSLPADLPDSAPLVSTSPPATSAAPATSASPMNSVGAATAIPPPAPSPSEQIRAAAEAARHCETPIAAITNRPNGGVIFNNAMTSADAGSIDRGRGVLDALAEQETSFRCCLDGWLQDRPGREESVMVRLVLGPDGVVRDAAILEDRTTLEDPVALACVKRVAEDISYPPSPTNNETVVVYPLRLASTAVQTDASKP